MLHTGILWLYARFGDGSPGFSWFRVLLVMVTRMDVLMRFQADVLLEILRVRVSGKVQVSRERDGSMCSWVSTALADFVTLRLIWGCTFSPMEDSATGSKTSFSECKAT